MQRSRESRIRKARGGRAFGIAVKSPLRTHSSLSECLISILALLFSIQFPANVHPAMQQQLMTEIFQNAAIPTGDLGKFQVLTCSLV